VDLKHLAEFAQGRDHAVELPVGNLDRHECHHVVAQRLEVDFPAVVPEDPGPHKAADAALRGVAGNP
jgi:hypothetical protein